MRTQATIISLALCALVAPQLQAQSAPWVFGLGTGFALLDTEGTQGFNTNVFGPIESEYDLSPGDVKDLLETAFGFGALATNGTWTANFSYGKLKLGGDVTGMLDAGFGSFDWAAEAFFEVSGGEVTVGRTVYRSAGGGFSLTPHVGARYTKHELGLDLTVSDGVPATEVSRSTDESWTDVLVGTSLAFQLSPKVSWSTMFDAGFGGSEGTYRAATAIAWSPAMHWVISPNASFMKVKFENGAKGDSDWYFYDSDDITVGLAVMYLFF